MNKKVNNIKHYNFNITLCVIAFLCLLVIYACISGNFSFAASDTTNINLTSSAMPIFLSNTGNDIIIDINNSNNEEIIFSSDTVVNISLSSSYTNVSTCTYKLYWNWLVDNNYDNYVQSVENEIMLLGKINDNIIFNDIQIPSYIISNNNTLLYTGTIVSNGGSIENQAIVVTTNFYKTDSNIHNNKKYAARLVIDDVSCEKTA